MEVVLDQQLEIVIESPGYKVPLQSLKLRRSATAAVRVRFASGNSFVDPGAPQIYFVVKEAGKFDQDPPLILTAAFTKLGTEADALWLATVNLITETLNELFAVDDDEANDVSEILAMCEFVWDDGEQVRRTGQIPIRLQNNVFRGDEEPPVAEPAPGTYVPVASLENIRYLDGVVQLEGGTAAALDTVPTLGVPHPRLFGLRVPGQPRFWRLRAGTEETGPGIVRPLDYDAEGNAVVFEAAGEGIYVLATDPLTLLAGHFRDVGGVLQVREVGPVPGWREVQMYDGGWQAGALTPDE